MKSFKATKKPVTIEAILFDGLSDENVDMCEKFCQDTATAMFDAKGSYCIRIKTLEGSTIASKGDYIIKGVQGEFYPCKPDIFKATYDTEMDEGIAGMYRVSTALEGKVTIGKYELIRQDDKSIWIQSEDGAQFSEESVEAVIDKFYNDNF